MRKILRISAYVLSVATAVVVLCAHDACAQDMPLPERKPAGGVTIFQLEPNEAAEEQPEQGESFNVIDFTASLLNFTSIPVPQKKPEIPENFNGFLFAGAEEPISDAPIAGSQARLYKDIFEAQESAEFDTADEKIKKLKDKRLLGHVLFQRFMHPKAYKSSFPELSRWLEHYSDHPGADRIYKLATLRQPEGSNARLKTPKIYKGIARTQDPTMHQVRRYLSPRKRTDADINNINRLRRNVFSYVRKGEPEGALTQLQQGAGTILDAVEYDLLQAEVASSFLYEGNTEQAFHLATKSVARSGLHVPKAGWVAGLVSWQRTDYKNAARYFEVVARSSYASSWTVSAGAYWAARSHMKQGDVRNVSIWLKRAMAYPRTFYGLVATRALGRDFDFNWKVPPFTKQYMQMLSALPAANRAMALVDAGQLDLAQSELIRITPKNEKQRDALLSYAAYANLPGLAMRIAASTSDPSGGYYDAALYPKGPWQPQDGYQIDPALVHAIMRQESRFDPKAKSHRGAEGLMQLMPRTAKYVAGSSETELNNPETNLALGQRYLANLLTSSVVEGDLLSLLIAYNAGPGNLARWKNRWPDIKDPLVFIELIPSSETRAYVERVLSNYWIYRLKEGQETPTLDALAAGKAVQYNGQPL